MGTRSVLHSLNRSNQHQTIKKTDMLVSHKIRPPLQIQAREQTQISTTAVLSTKLLRS